MAERFAERILAGTRGPLDDSRSSVSGERQLGALSFNVQVIFKDGRRARGFAMSHYSDYEWTDEGDKERLVILFGMRALTIEGELLAGTVDLLNEGRLTHIEEMTHSKVQELKRDNPHRLPIISRVTVDPDFQTILSAIKGEEEDEIRYPRRVK